MEKKNKKIHPTAIVSKKAKLGASAQIGPYSIIEDDVKIGEGTKIGAHCVIHANTTIGKHCELFSGVIAGSRPQDLKYKGEKSYLEIGNYNVIREYCMLNPGTGQGAAKTVIGSHNLLMAYAHVAHDCEIGDHCIIANCGTLAGHVVVEDGAVISGLVAVHQFVRIGRLSIIGGCSKVVRDIPPFSTCDGHPARLFGLNLIGLKRHNISKDAIAQLRRAFKILFYSGLSLRHALDKIQRAAKPGPEVAYLADFIRNSKRGIVRSCRSEIIEE